MAESISINNQQLLATWVNDFSDDLFSWAYHKTSSREVAEDLVQETFMAAYKGIDRFKGESKPKTWLTSILNNKIVDHYRKESRGFAKSLSEEETLTGTVFNNIGGWKNPEVSPMWEDEDHLLDNVDFNSVLESCISGLPERFGIAINAKYVLGKKADEICQELECTPSNYWQMLHRGKLLLKKCLEKNWTS